MAICLVTCVVMSMLKYLYMHFLWVATISKACIVGWVACNDNVRSNSIMVLEYIATGGGSEGHGCAKLKVNTSVLPWSLLLSDFKFPLPPDLCQFWFSGHVPKLSNITYILFIVSRWPPRLKTSHHRRHKFMIAWHFNYGPQASVRELHPIWLG